MTAIRGSVMLQNSVDVPFGAASESGVGELSSGRPFWVLLGADYCGKSSALTELAARDGWSTVSSDDELVSAEHDLISRLRHDFVNSALRGVGTLYSPDFVLSLLQASVVHLRDAVLDASPDDRVLVDSYYYKILAKCLISGYVNQSMFDWWRTFPKPSGVIYLEIDPVLAWERSGRGRQVNGFEHYGPEGTFEGFARFQRDLHRTMMAEVDGLPVYRLPQLSSVGALVHEIDRITGA